MSRIFPFVMVALLSLAATPPASAAEPDQQAPTVGIGAKLPVASVGPFGELGALGGLGGLVMPTASGTLLSPIKVSNSLRLEPHIGVGMSLGSTTQSDTANDSETDTEQWAVDLGGAAHALWSPFDATLGYVGLQAGVGWTKWTREGPSLAGGTTTRENDSLSVYAGPVVGGEYQPNEALGFGVEASLALQYTETSSSRAQQAETSRVGLGSHASLFARIYLW